VFTRNLCPTITFFTDGEVKEVTPTVAVEGHTKYALCDSLNRVIEVACGWENMAYWHLASKVIPIGDSEESIPIWEAQKIVDKWLKVKNE
jgi:hypothetical protein